MDFQNRWNSFIQYIKVWKECEETRINNQRKQVKERKQRVKVKAGAKSRERRVGNMKSTKR